MKKICIICAILLFGCVCSKAQHRGDMAIELGGEIDFSKSELRSIFPEFSFTIPLDNPQETNVLALVKFGWFVSDRIRLGLRFDVPYSSVPELDLYGEWKRLKSISVNVEPNIAWFIPLAYNIHYAPELGAILTAGSFSKLNAATGMIKPIDYTGCGCCLRLLSFEARINRRVAVGFGSGEVHYKFSQWPESSTSGITTKEQRRDFGFNLNRGHVGVILYM